LTTTDANLCLGRLNKKDFCGGKKVDEGALSSALTNLASQLKVPEQEAARAVVGIANNKMVNAIKQISVNRGHDPREYTLMAFGGGGGMHGALLAKELGIKKLIVPKMSSVFSAWGMLLTDVRKDYFLSQFFALSSEESVEKLQGAIEQLKKKAESEALGEKKGIKY